MLAQDPQDAKYDGMPGAAIATGLVDYVLPAADMPEQLVRYMKLAKVKRVPAEVEEKAPLPPLQKIFSVIRMHTGHDFSFYKQNTVMRRIERRMAVLQTESLDEYLEYLRNNPYEIEVLFKELLIRVTNFFRDAEAFEALRTKTLPAIFQNKPADSAGPGLGPWLFHW